MRMGKMLYSESSKKTEKNPTTPHQVFKRPHGVAVLNLTEIINKDDNEEKECSLKVYQGEEKDFHQLHEFIIRQSGKISVLSCQPNYGKYYC